MSESAKPALNPSQSLKRLRQSQVKVPSHLRLVFVSAKRLVNKRGSLRFELPEKVVEVLGDFPDTAGWHIISLEQG